MAEFSTIVSDGMKRVCIAFAETADRFGFVQTKSRLWVRLAQHSAETIYLYRHGSSYGAPRTASVYIRVELAISILNNPSQSSGILQYSDQIRRNNGAAYHHRFNAQSGSTYDRCVEELSLFICEYAEPWFARWRNPADLATHPDLSQSGRELLAEAMSGRESADNVAAALKMLGLTGRKLARASRNLAPN